MNYATEDKPEVVIAKIIYNCNKNKMDYIIEKSSDLTKVYVEYFTIRFMRYNNVTDMIISAFPEAQKNNIETYFNSLHKILNNI